MMMMMMMVIIILITIVDESCNDVDDGNLAGEREARSQRISQRRAEQVSTLQELGKSLVMMVALVMIIMVMVTLVMIIMVRMVIIIVALKGWSSVRIMIVSY